MRILTRYILLELGKVFLVSLTLLTGLMTLTLLVHEAVKQGLPPGQILRLLPYILPGALLFAKLAKQIQAKRAIVVSLVLWIGIVTYAFIIKTASEFWILGGLVGLILGGSQAMSRSLYGQLIPKDDRMGIEVHIKKVERDAGAVIVFADAGLWKNQIRIYEITDAAIRLEESEPG